jgi:hypothetical protein
MVFSNLRENAMLGVCTVRQQKWYSASIRLWSCAPLAPFLKTSRPPPSRGGTRVSVPVSRFMEIRSILPARRRR